LKELKKKRRQIMEEQVLIKSNLSGVDLLRRGKVRDVYDLGDELLIISTDRISCFDVVLPSPIPDKGKVLTSLSLFWFDYTRSVVANHLLSTRTEDYPDVVQPYQALLRGRSMLVRKAKSIPVECIVRGYLSGSGWKEYQQKGTVCQQPLPPGLQESAKLPEPIFTPSTKEEVGHDINVSEEYVTKELGADLTARLKSLSLALYQKAAAFAETKGIIIADTKFEFGLIEDEVILIDEALTPDSSRFWPKDQYSPGQGQPSFDKQYVRDYLETLDWDKKPPAPELPAEIVKGTSEKYSKIYQLLTGKKL
jgi:phosphoribosylaminoimidazole-succinocarboxamide synthase